MRDRLQIPHGSAHIRVPGVQEAQNSAQLQMQQYVVDIQALERNGDALARELQAAKGEAEDLARDRNRVVEQMQAAQVRAPAFGAPCVPTPPNA